ncbi:GGDEF domain-containing protein [Pigmentiphaga aceris]|uniref:diguanylate cyclase n=2 Tax=Pigmentiphaga aceris TaxID=1940612 RepID=A0A5C0B4M2_9BURK|nr:GGDEF domain-containing protein [Pigmentiphaga aceris]
MGLLAIAFAALWIDREKTWEGAANSARNVLALLEGDISRTIRGYDLSLSGVIDGMSAPGIDTLSPDMRQRVLFDGAAAAEHLGSLLVIDALGNVVHDSASTRPRQGNFADRDYFRAHRDRADVGLFISAPFRSRLRGGDPSIALSRRLSAPDGSFAGVVSGTLRLSYFRDLFQRLKLGTDDSITLLRDDGIVLMRDPYAEGIPGTNLRASPVISRFLDRGESGFVGKATLDGVSRYYNFARLQGLPLFMNVNISPDGFLKPWRQRSWVISITTLLLCAAVMTLTLLFQRELRRRQQVERKLELLAQTDGLTGLVNRRAFDLALQTEFDDARRTGALMSLLFVDADRFKYFNDRYGHQAGDEVLRRIGDVLREHARRPRDVAARYGGEEFVLLLPATGAAQAVEIAERLRTAVMALSLPHDGLPGGVCTVSVGVASGVSAGSEDRAAMLMRADAALYRAKQAGRNRTELAA